MSLADSGGVVLTGRLACAAEPWLADHVVRDAILFPGSGFVELAVRAGDHAGCGVLEELALHAPLVLPEDGAVAVQIVVGAADESGRRSVGVYAREEGTPGTVPEREWTLHAEGVLADSADAPAFDLTAWPPPGADPLPLDGAYETLRDRGLAYGQAFRGLTPPGGSTTRCMRRSCSRPRWRRTHTACTRAARRRDARRAGGRERGLRRLR
ncbi:hypothetical protein ACFSNO_33720 [Streptomyces cirratus]